MKLPNVIFPHRSNVIPFLGQTGVGPKWDEVNPNKNVRCHIEPKVRRIKRTDGDDIDQTAEGLFPDGVIRQGDRVEHDGKTYTAEQVTPIRIIGNKVGHVEVILT